jgi:hypothetical protein
MSMLVADCDRSTDGYGWSEHGQLEVATRTASLSGSSDEGLARSTPLNTPLNTHPPDPGTESRTYALIGPRIT